MMLARAGLLVLVGSAPVWPAAAQDRPPDVPTRDVTATYRVEGGAPNSGPQTIKMSYKANGDRMRVDEDHVSYTIMDGTTKRTYMVSTPERSYMEAPFDPQAERGFVPPGLKFSREGTDTVAGLPCTVWKAQMQNNTSTACITADGVMLRAEQGGGAPGEPAQRIVAVSVDYSPQPDSLFVPPAGFRRVQPPPGPPGGMQGGPQGGPPGGPPEGAMPGGPPPGPPQQ
jgi:hypothetical protein